MISTENLKSLVLLKKFAAMVAPGILGNQKKTLSDALLILILKVTKFQLSTPKRFSTVVKIIFGGHRFRKMAVKLSRGRNFEF